MNLIKKETILTRDFILLFSINFISYAGMQLFNSILAKYALSIGAPDGLVGLVVSAYALMIFVASMLSSLFIDRFNKKTILNIAMIGQALAVLGYALISQNIYILLALRLFHGLSSGLIMTVSMAMVGFALPKTKLGMGMGIYGLGQTLAMAVGPYIGIELVNRIGYRNMFLIAFALVSFSALLSFLVMSVPAEKTVKNKFSLKKIIYLQTVPVSTISFFNAVAYSTIVAYLVIHADIQGVGDIGLYFTVYSAFILISRPLLGSISDKLRLEAVVYPAIIFMAASLVLSSYASSLTAFLVAAFFMALGFGGAMPVLQAAAIRNVPNEKRGSASATYMMGTSLGFIVGPIAGSSIALRLGYGSMFRVMAAISLLGIPVIMINTLIQKRRSRSSEQKAES